MNFLSFSSRARNIEDREDRENEKHLKAGHVVLQVGKSIQACRLEHPELIEEIISQEIHIGELQGHRGVE